jgi:hypothetical protein
MLLITTPAWADSQTKRLSGRVYDAKTNEGIPFAAIYIIDSGFGVMADVDGNYSIAITNTGNREIRISSVGYGTRTITWKESMGTKLNVALSPQSVALEDVTVTAKYNDKVGSDVTIDQEALEYIQPTSLQDVFQLLPGGTIGSNNMQNRQLASSRQVGADESTSFGMGITIDGVPLHNDGQRVQMTGFTGTGPVDNEGNKSINTGVDMRSISTDHIETVTVGRGIASAKEGNISSGNIRVTQKQGQSPLRIRVKFDPLNKLAYIGKGIRLPNRAGTLYLGSDIVRSATSSDDTRGAYNRITAQANWNNKRYWLGKMIDMSVRAGYITSFNNNKSDDIIEANQEDYSTRYQRTMFSARLNAELNSLIIDGLELLASADYTTDILKYNKRVVNNTVIPMQNLSEEGEHEGEYLPATYHTFYKLDDRPLNAFAQLTASKFGTIFPQLDYSVILGAAANYVKNLGMGAEVNPSRPPYPSSDFIRPRANKDIPAIAHQAGYAELRLNWRYGANSINTQFGIRETMMLNLPSHYDLHGRMLWEPRLQMSYTYNFSNEESQRNSITLRGGYGVENKLPSADFLYPDKVYHDFIALNAYFSDPSKRLLLINTKIEDPTNPHIRENKNRKIELGVDLKYNDYVLSLTAFREKMNGGIQYFTQYTPVAYTYYYELKHQVDGKPTRDDFYSKERHSFMQLKKPMNSAEVTKTGFEYRLHIPKIKPLKTEIEINGAYYKSVYSSGIPVMYYPSVMINNEPYPYVGLYDGYEKTYAEQFNTNLWFNTHMPKLKLIFTNFIQIIWFEKSRLGTDVDIYPTQFMDNSGNIRFLTQEMIEQDATFSSLQRNFQSARYNELKLPVSLRMTLKLTKEFNRHVKLSFFADNIIQISKKYKDNYMQTRRNWHKPYFGAELTINIL